MYIQSLQDKLDLASNFQFNFNKDSLVKVIISDFKDFKVCFCIKNCSLRDSISFSFHLLPSKNLKWLDCDIFEKSLKPLTKIELVGQFKAGCGIHDINSWRMDVRSKVNYSQIPNLPFLVEIN